MLTIPARSPGLPRGSQRIEAKGLRRSDKARPAVGARHKECRMTTSPTSIHETPLASCPMDHATLGILHSRFYDIWTRRADSDQVRSAGSGSREPSRSVLSFPFPQGLSPAEPADKAPASLSDGCSIPAHLPAEGAARATAVARAMRSLMERLDDWLNPPEWTERVREVVLPGTPYRNRTVRTESRQFVPPFHVRITRTVVRTGFEHELAKRTLANLYGAQPAWLAQLHERLDAEVARAYHWHDYNPIWPEQEVLRRLQALSRESAARVDMATA